MTSEIVIIRLLALCAGFCGIGLMQAAWRLNSRSWPHITGAWILLVGSVVAWGYTSGADKGAALGIVANVMIAVIFLVIAAVKSKPRPEKTLRPKQTVPDDNSGTTSYSRRVCSGLIIGPIAGLVALAISTAAFVGLQMVNAEYTINLTIVSLAFPLLWAGLSVFAGYQVTLWRKATTVIGVGVLSLLYIWIAA